MMSHIEMEYAKTLKQVSQLERELDEAKEQLRLCNVDQFTTAAELAEAQAKISATRRWVNNNMTFYDVEPDGPDVCTSGPNIPTLAGVSKRIWYHATDNQTVSLFSEVIDLRQWEGK
jgi:hypothetical protein